MCSTMLHILALLCGVAVLTGVQAECQTTAEGYTWSFQTDRDEMLFDISSAEECLSSCYGDPNCIGYTWLTDAVVDVCYKFQVLEGQLTCSLCYSGTVPTIFQEEACKEDLSYLITVVTADSSERCYTSCVDTNECISYTWYNKTTWFPDYCFLYGECVQTIPCLGCSSGILNCIGQSSTTTSPATSSTTTAPATSTFSTSTNTPIQCFNHYELTDPTRSVVHGGGYYCDDDNYHTSPEWKGPGYYRLLAPAGVKIPTSSPGYGHCGSSVAGWINDEEGAIDQMEIEQEISTKVCFGWFLNPCEWNNEITVTLCPGDYYVYYLPNAPACDLRYCASN